MAEKNQELMEKIVSLCKRRGFVFPGSEIYGGLAGTFDYGPLGVALRNNIKALWWKRFVTDREDMYGMDAAILMNQNAWKASGHVGGFNDPSIEDVKTKKRYRVDHLLEDQGVDTKGLSNMVALIIQKGIKSPEGNPLGDAKQFNMMFKTHVGSTEGEESVTYLRPETAGGMFVNFKNILDSFHPKLPFGMAQIGKAFRNEIAPRDFIFRLRELEQMEIEYFVDPRDPVKVDQIFNEWFDEQVAFLKELGLPESKIHKLEVPEADRAHYSKRSVDTEFDFAIGQKELLGLAYRTDFDLNAHASASGTDLSYYDEETKERVVPHCIEPTFGVDRVLLAVLSSAYTEDELGGETRTYLKFAPKVAPVIVAVSPLLKNKPELVSLAREVFVQLKKKFGRVSFDDNGNIGKRYRRQDEVGTPFCVVIDFDTLEQKTGVTVRDRDTGEQARMQVPELIAYIEEKIA